MMLEHIKPAPTHVGRFGRRVILPVAALVGGAIFLVLGVVTFTSARQDALALDASTRLAQTALSVKQHEIGRNLKDYAVWEDAYKNLSLQLDLDWAATDGNVGANVYNSLGYDMAFVVAPDGRTVYAVLEGKPQKEGADAFALVPNGLDGLVRQAREAPVGGEPVVGLLRSGADVLIVAAAAIVPPAGAEEPPPVEGRSVLLFVDKVDAAFLSRMSQQYLLADLRLLGPDDRQEAAPPPSSLAELRRLASLAGDYLPAGLVPASLRSEPAVASLTLATPSGAGLGRLVWRPDEPGQELLRILLPPLVLALIGLAAFAALVLRNAKRAAQAIEASARTVEAYAETLERSEARFRDVAEASSDWIWETDAELRLTYVSSRFDEVTGVAAASVLGRTLERFFSSDTVSDGWAALREATRTRGTFRDLRCCYRDAQGGSRVCRLAGRPTRDHAGTFLGYRGTAADITAEVEAHERANHLALHDALTELPNRILLRERLELALAAVKRQQSRVAVLCLDLDHFKEVNDTLGHGAGDALLREVAARLQSCTRGMDTVARLGGDEFAIVQVSLDMPADAQSLCRRLVECLRAPFTIEGHELFVGASIGVALAPEDGLDHERLLKNADIALYRAKQAGRGTFRFFEPQMDSELQASKALEQDLRQALARGQLELHYQPLVSVRDHGLTGVEALMRWRHPERGVIAPGEFIPVAEETGLIIQLGEWALRTACAQARRSGRACGFPSTSPRSSSSTASWFRPSGEILDETGLAPELLELEITEGVLLYDTAASMEVLSQLKAIGVRIAMDDFGTGYSSLGYLNSFPFDKIKIDRSFVTDLNEKEKANAIVRSVIGLGQSLGMITNAEGVETSSSSRSCATRGASRCRATTSAGRSPPPRSRRWSPPGAT